jgi:hypothetical protein
MSLADFLDRIGTNFQTKFDAAGPQGLAQLGLSIASVPRNQWGTGLAAGLAQFGATANQNIKKKSLADALSGAMGDLTPQQQAFLKAMDPEQASQIVGSQLFKAPSEKWEQVDTTGDGVPDRQRSSTTGRIDDIPLSLEDRAKLASAGRSSVTVNNIPAEFGAKVGLGEGFLEKYDNIKARAKKFYASKSPYEQLKRRGQMIFNTGEGGELWRDVEIGREALVRQLTGAGMPESEAKDQASRYSIGSLDTDFDALSKLESLRKALINSASGAYKARGGTYTPPASGGDKPDPLGIR